MTSRRPNNHSYSGNGRYGSQNGDDVLSPRLDSRNYLSSVRPENRSTFCTVMTQLTEETQPCFETTIKSKAVSEACNVKFTCVVTGYPVPELTWYKDDMELDRYCGLPKYEIFRNGKVHTLHIYNCTVDDAAIYQASARNSKGIVSCSGVLEVGTMSEYKIHQRFFAKLKQKAELKRRELEHSYFQEKENILQEQLNSSENNVRWTVHKTSSLQVEKDSEANDGEITDEKPEEFNEELNRLSVKANRYPMKYDRSQDDRQHMSEDVVQNNLQLIYDSEKAEIDSPTLFITEKESKNKISNGFDKNLTIQPSQVEGKGSDAHEEASLATILLESLQLQFGENCQNTTLQSQEITCTKTSTIQKRERKKEVDTEAETLKAEQKHLEREKCCEGEQERSVEKEPETVRHFESENRSASATEAKTPVYNEPEYQHKSALSSVFHSLKDIFFGKSKKSPEITNSSKKVSDINVEQEILAVNTEPHCHLQQTQPKKYDTSSVCGTMPDQPVPVAVNQQNHTVNAEYFKIAPTLHTKTEMESLNLDNHIHDVTPSDIKDISQASKLHPERIEVEKESGSGAIQNNTSVAISEASGDHTEPNNELMLQVHHETAGQKCTAPTNHRMQDVGEIQVLKTQGDTAEFTATSTFSNQPNRTDLESCKSCSEAQISTPISETTLLVPNKCVNQVDEGIAECNLKNGSKDKINVAIPESTELMKKSKTDTVEDTEGIALSIHERGQANAISQDKSTPVLDMSHGKSYITESNITQNKNSDLVFNSFMDNSQGFAAGSVTQDTNKVETISVNIQTKKVDIIESKGDSKGESTNFISEYGTGISKHKNQPETEGLETHLRVVEKTQIYTKVRPERYTAESKDQSVISPIIILPDTRETVIKNVAKMRAVPCTPDIKAPEKVKHEEPFNVPKIDVLITEPERVIHPLINEVALIQRDNEPSSEETMGNASSAPDKNNQDDKVAIMAEPVEVAPPQIEKNDDCSPSYQKTIKVKTENLESQMGNRENPSRVNSVWSRGSDSSSIPIISIACADDITPLEEQQKVYEKPVFYETGHPNSAAPEKSNSKDSAPTVYLSSSSEVESSTEYSIKKEIICESLTVKPREVVSHVDSAASNNTNRLLEKAALQEEQTEKKNLVDIQLSSDISSAFSKKALQNTTACDTEVFSDKESKMEPDADRFQKDKPAMEKLGLTTPVGPTLPPLSPASLRRLMAKNNTNLESQGSTSTLGNGSEKKGEDSGGSTPTSTLSCESSPKMKRRDSLTLIPSATPEELASGARRKIYLAKAKSEDDGSDTQSKKESPYMSPSQARRAAFLQLQSGQQAQQMEKRSPLLGRRKTTAEENTAKEEPSEETNMCNTESKPAEKDPYKAPQVIRKIRGEPFSDALGHLKLWCQFFNVLSDSTIKWFKDDVKIAEIKRSAGDESQVALAIVQASSRDCGVYACTINNEYGTDTTDYLLSSDILAEFFLRDDLEVGEEIEMTPLLFTKGLVDPGYWGNKFFGRIMIKELQIGEGCVHKNSRAKVIYGLDPVFESGSTCIVKVRNQVVYGAKEENSLAEINLNITKQECKIHNTVREYCKIFAAEARVNDKFGFALEVIPLYLIYRPANNIPYATMEAELKGVYLKYCTMDNTGRLITRTTSEVEQKCCTFQHWIYQWTNGNLLVTQLEGVDAKITNIKIATKSKGYQSLTDEGSPKFLEQFVIQHKCNYYCGLLGLRALTTMDSLQQSKLKTSKSPLMARRVGLTDSSSPQLLKKGSSSPQTAKKINSSPKVAKKTEEDGDNNPGTKNKTPEVPKSVRMSQ